MSAAGPSADLPGSGPVRGSGDEAVARAEARAAVTRAVNIGSVPALPIPADTANVRQGPEIDETCLALLPLIGVWRGTGMFGGATLSEAPQFGQQIVISHDGRVFLRFESVCWLLDETGAVTGQGAREVGWLRPRGGDGIELLLTRPEGVVEVYVGQARSLTTWELSTDGILRTADADGVTAATRLYGITADGALAYVEERTIGEGDPAPHASAVLQRIAG